MDDDGVRPSQLKFNQVLQESSKHWSTYRKAADVSSLLPHHCIDLTPLLGRIPAFLASGRLSIHETFSFTCQEREAAHGRYGLLTSGHSIWRTSDGHCDTEPKIISLQLLLAVPEPLKVRFSDNAPLANWPGVQGVSGIDLTKTTASNLPSSLVLAIINIHGGHLTVRKAALDACKRKSVVLVLIGREV